jgi:hypothetical protein
MTGRWFANRRSSRSSDLDVVDRARLIADGTSLPAADRWARIATFIAAGALLIPAAAFVGTRLIGGPSGEIISAPSETRLPHVFDMTIVDPRLTSVTSQITVPSTTSLTVPAIDPAASGAPIDPAEPSGGPVSAPPTPEPSGADETTRVEPPTTTTEPLAPTTVPSASRPLPAPSTSRPTPPPTTVDVVVTTVPPSSGPPTTVDAVVTTVPPAPAPPTTVDVINPPSTTVTPTTTTSPPAAQVPVPPYPRDDQLCVDARVGIVCIPWQFPG